MTITPTSKHYIASPGETIKGSFSILNDGDVPYDFIVYGSPYSVTDVSYDPVYEEDRPRSDAYRWAQFQQTKWHANVRQMVEVPFTLQISKNASPGGHYGILFAETQPTSAEGVVRKKRLGMLLFVTVKGDVRLSGETKNVSINPYQPIAPMRASARLVNSGNTDFEVTSLFEVSDLFGGVKYSQANQHTVFPGTSREIEFTWGKSPWFGLYRVHAEVTTLGKRTASDSLVLVAPHWLLFVGSLVVLLGVIHVIRTKKKRQVRLSSR